MKLNLRTLLVNTLHLKAKITNHGEKFIGDANWLSGQAYARVSNPIFSQAITKIHQINDHSGKTVTATWM